MNTTYASRVGRQLAKSSRPQNIIYSGLLASLTALCVGVSVSTALLCYVTILFLYAFAAGYNNIHDIKTDRLNKRLDNPLLQGILSTAILKIFFGLCFILLLLLQFFLKQPASIFITGAYVLLTVLYSHPKLNIMSKGLGATILLGLCYGVLPFLLGALQASTTLPLYSLTLFELLLVLPIILAKDYKDLKGDRLTQKRTPLVLYGPKIVMQLALSVSISVVVVYLFIALQLNSPILMVLVTSLLYIVGIYYLHRTQGVVSKTVRRLLTLTLLGMTLVLLA